MVAGAPCEFIVAESSTYEHWLRFELSKKSFLPPSPFPETLSVNDQYSRHRQARVIGSFFSFSFFSLSRFLSGTRRLFDLPLVLRSPSIVTQSPGRAITLCQLVSSREFACISSAVATHLPPLLCRARRIILLSLRPRPGRFESIGKRRRERMYSR